MGTVRHALKHGLRPRILGVVAPLCRAYLQQTRTDAGKRWLWTHAVRPYVANAPYEFVARTFFGSTVAGNTRDLIQRYIYYFGVWEPNLTRWMGSRLGPGDVFVDVGANVGYYSLYASTLVGRGGRVVAVEASPTIFERLRKNIELNRADNVRAVNVAAAESRQRLRLYRGPESNRGRTTTLADAALEVECEVEALPLSELLTAREVQNARIVKIDVEGAEWSVVQGLAPALGACRKDVEITLEVSPARLAQQGRRPEDVVAIFQAVGFNTYSVANDYQATAYLPPRRVQTPVRVTSPIDRQVDLIFSREDADTLA